MLDCVAARYGIPLPRRGTESSYVDRSGRGLRIVAGAFCMCR
ncbi:MAG: hypothetical protein ACO2PN_13800 [Pyrobaculum sp.]